MKSITAVLAFGAIFATLNLASGTFSDDKGDDGGERYVRVTSVNGIGSYGDSGYDNRGYDYGSHGHGGYPSSYGHSSYGPKYGGASHGPVSHYTDIIIKEDDSKGDKGFFKGLKGLGKGFKKGVDHFVKKGKGFVGLDSKYEFVGVLRPKKYGGYGDDHHGGYGDDHHRGYGGGHHGGYGGGHHGGAGGVYYDDGYAPIH